MRILKRIIRPALIAAAMCALLCQGVQARGVDTNYTQVNGEVAKGARKKYTKLRGKGKDSVTMMVYMLGTDLESQSGMATADLNEMLYAGLDNRNVNVVVQTGGCRRSSPRERPRDGPSAAKGSDFWKRRRRRPA